VFVRSGLNPIVGFDNSDLYALNGVVLDSFAIPVLQHRLHVSSGVRRPYSQLVFA
jgi:hypothetical protein